MRNVKLTWTEGVYNRMDLLISLTDGHVKDKDRAVKGAVYTHFHTVKQLCGGRLCDGHRVDH